METMNLPEKHWRHSADEVDRHWKYANQSPWAIRVGDISGRVGESQELDITLPAPSGIGDDFYGITADSDVDVTGHFDAIKDGLVFIGEATADVHGQCSRCLKDLSGPLSVNFTVFMPLKASTAEEDERLGRGTSAQKDVNVDEDEGEDVYPLLEDGMYADLESLLRDAFADAMPQTPLCQSDCKGLCPLDGVNLNDHPKHHHEQEGDERWSALASLKAQLEAKED